MTTPLIDERVAAALESLHGWTHKNNALQKSYSFSSFPEAISFITRIAFEAERRNHHPHIHNVYSTVDLSLTTHDADNRVTERDVELAKAIEAISWV